MVALEKTVYVRPLSQHLAIDVTENKQDNASKKHHPSNFGRLAIEERVL